MVQMMVPMGFPLPLNLVKFEFDILNYINKDFESDRKLKAFECLIYCLSSNHVFMEKIYVVKEGVENNLMAPKQSIIPSNILQNH